MPSIIVAMKRPTIDQQVTFLHCDNLQNTAVFYEDILGFPMVLDQGKCRIYQVNDTAFLGFCTTLGAHLTRTERNGIMLTLVSDDVDDWHRYLVDHGIPIEKPPTHNEVFNIYQLFVRDPNGYLVEIQTFLDEAWPRRQESN